MSTSKKVLKEYLEAEEPSEILNNSFRNVLPIGDVVIDGVHHDLIGGIRVAVSVTEEGDDFADTYMIKILFMDLITYLYKEVNKDDYTLRG